MSAVGPNVKLRVGMAGARDPEIVVLENRRLQSEVVLLSARLDAFERSRWWRSHPRFALRRLRSRFVSTEHAERLDASRIPESPTVVDSLIARFRVEVLSRGNFGYDTTRNLPILEPFLRELEGRSSRILEIGSLEGLSASFFLWRLPNAHVTCVDTFAGSHEDVVFGLDVAGSEAVFDRNVSVVDATRVRKLVGDSRRVLLDLASEEQRFDLVYIDGSHLALDVLVDASLSWQVLAPGGFVVFDDYEWKMLGTDPLSRPGPAIDAFLRLVEHDCEILHKQKYVIVRKLNVLDEPSPKREPR